MSAAAPILEHRYQPRGGCLDLWHNRAPQVLVSGPAGTGKSRSCLEKLHFAALANPRMRGLIIRKTQVSMTSTALVTYRTEVAVEAIAAGVVHYFGGNSQEPAAYRYENGSTIVLGGIDKPTKIMSSQYDMIYVQEAIELTKDDWESLTTRLRNGVMSFQQLLADTNPSSPTHWLKQACDEGRVSIVESRHEDNPRLFTEQGTVTPEGAEYIALLDNLTGHRKPRLRHGRWTSAEGVIYEQWDEAVHLVDRFPIPDTWPRYWAVDFGFTNPFVLQCWAEDPDGRAYMYREIYRSKVLVEDHARRILDIVAPRADPEDPSPDAKRPLWLEPKPRAVICDHDAEGRATLQKYLGRSTTAADKRVKAGIQAVEARIRLAGDGKPRLFILRDSVVDQDPDLVAAGRPWSTASEIPGYVWDRPKEGKPDKDEPLKVNDHGCDAKRYYVAHRDLGPGSPGVRFM